MPARRFLCVFAACCFGWAALTYTCFFFNLASTISDWSGTPVLWSYQFFYNFLHGRPLQYSVYAAVTGLSMGWLSNPYAYVHTFAVHVNVIPYLFAWVWALHPTLAWLYGLIYLWNFAGAALFTVLILKRLDPERYREKSLLALAVLFGSGWSNVLDQLAHFLLFSGPIMMAATYFLLERRHWAFVAAVLALCLVSEDAAMVAACLAAYVFLFEPERRADGLAAGAVAVPYLALALFVIQKAARYPLAELSSTNAAHVMSETFHLSPAILATNLRSMLPIYTLVPAIPLAGALFGWPAPGRFLQLCALAILPALPHWGECVVVGSAHHLLPPFTFTYLALVGMLGTAAPGPVRRPAALLAAVVFGLLSIRTTAGKLPNGVKPRLYRLLGKVDKAQTLERAIQGQRDSNLAVIAAARAVPSDRSVTFLTNKNAAGFIGDRRDLWLFPAFYDLADDLLIQKDATDSVYVFDPASAPDLAAAVARGRAADRRDAPVTPAMVTALRESLVSSGKYRVAREDEHVLVLERVERHAFYLPPETVGLGFLANAGKKRVPVAPRW